MRPLRVLCIGDSLTAGARGVRWTDWLSARLGDRAEVVVRGIPGATAADLARIFPEPGPAAALVITAGTNEVLAGFSPPFSRALRVLRGRPVDPAPEATGIVLARWLEGAAASSLVVLCGVAVAGAEDHPSLAERLERCNRSLRAAAEGLGGLFVPPDPEILASPGAEIPFSRLAHSLRWRLERCIPAFRRPVDPQAPTFDGVHLAPRGAERLAAEVYARVASRLRETGRSL